MKKFCFFGIILIFLFLLISPAKLCSANKMVEFYIEKQTENIARQIEIYVSGNSGKTFEDFMQDQNFVKIITQQVGENGYCVITDPENKQVAFHPNRELIGSDLSFLAEKYPDFYSLYLKGLAEDDCGYYDWPEDDGTVSQKYLCGRRIKEKFGDKYYSLALTAYIDDFSGLVDDRLDDGNNEEDQHWTENQIKLSAQATAKEIGKYLEENPEKTIEDLQNDQKFQEIAIRQAGLNGYTAVLDANTGYFYFHPQAGLANTDARVLKDKLPDWWSIISETIGSVCTESSGYYNWQEEDGTITQKYMYLACVEGATKDGKSLFVGATTYIDELIAENYLEKYQVIDFDYAEEAIRQKAQDVAKQVEIYLKTNPDMTVQDLQNDEYFQSIAVQKVGETGYTSITDQDDSMQYFHPDPEMIGIKLEEFKDVIPELWDYFSTDLLGQCNNAGFFYSWPDPDGVIRDKYAYSVCVPIKTADGKTLGIDASSYLDEFSSRGVKEEFSGAKKSIRTQAENVAKQIDIYIKLNPEATVKDLQESLYFQEIAVQPVGKTGYTAVTDYNSLVCRFHKNPEIVNKDLSTLKDRLPGFWEIMSRTKGGKTAEGMYDWEDADSKIKPKYMYIALVNQKTADGIGLHVAATTYLDEYEINDIEEQENKPVAINPPSEDRINFVLWFVGLGAGIFITVALLYYFKIVKFEKTGLVILLFIIFVYIVALFIVSASSTSGQIKQDALSKHIEQHMLEHGLQASEIQALFSGINSELKFLADSAVNPEVSPSVFSRYLKSSYERQKKYAYASYRINGQGIIEEMYPIDGNSLGADISGQAHMEKIKITLEPVVSNIFDAVEGFKGVTVHFPVIKHGQYDGTVAQLINIDKLVDELSISNFSCKNHYHFLLDGVGDIIRSNEAQYLGKNIMDIPVYKEIKADFSDIIDSTENGYKKFKLNGENVLLIHHSVPMLDNNWKLLLADNEENAYISINKTYNNIWFLTFLIIIALIIAGFILNYYFTRSLRQEVEAKTKLVQIKAEELEESLKKEAEMNKTKQRLLEQQKKSKQELEQKNEELQKFNKLAVGRELRMIELKKKIKELEEEK